jgi:hypothetical protein
VNGRLLKDQGKQGHSRQPVPKPTCGHVHASPARPQAAPSWCLLPVLCHQQPACGSIQQPAGDKRVAAGTRWLLVSSLHWPRVAPLAEVTGTAAEIEACHVSAMRLP